MSRECCGPDDDYVAPGDRAPIGLSLSLTARNPARRDAASAGCCAHDEPRNGHDDQDHHGGDHHEHDDDGPSPAWYRDRAVMVPIGAGVALAVGYGLEWGGFIAASVVVLALSLLLGASTFVPGAVRRLLRRRLGVGLLMSIAAVGAVLLGHIGEAAALSFLFAIAEALEDRALDRAKRGLRALLALVPETARVSRMSGIVEIPVGSVEELDLLEIRPGDRVPTDGVVTTGRSSIDASAVTGESIPVEVGPGDPVAAGSVNGSGVLLVEATASGRDNSLTTIVTLVEQAHARKGDRARLADRIARPLVPLVLLAALLIVVFGFVVGDPLTWTERALVVLVAASPCALAIAVPVTVISAIGASSRFGVVITSGEAFERLGAVQTVAFDKTGTLTRNRPDVVEVLTAGVSRDEVVRLAAALEASSTHPLARAIVAAGAAIGARGSAQDVEEHAGHGITGVIDGVPVRIGAPRWVAAGSLGREVAALERAGMTVVVVETDGVVVGALGIRDELKPEAATALGELASAGMGVVMLTGDNRRTAEAIAREVGITDVRAELLPAGKAEAIVELGRGRVVAMVGDGINDAPALASADVGIAMGASGSAVAVESADVVFTGADLRLLPQAIAHAQHARRIMTGNIVLALAIIVVLFPLALFGVLGLASVVLVHELAEVVVIANGLRAARGRALVAASPERAPVRALR